MIVLCRTARGARHAARLWRAGQIRFRLETYGLYYPAPPYTAPIWRVSPRVLVQLVRQVPAYLRWLDEMEAIMESGADGWWARETRPG